MYFIFFWDFYYFSVYKSICEECPLSERVNIFGYTHLSGHVHQSGFEGLRELWKAFLPRAILNFIVTHRHLHERLDRKLVRQDHTGDLERSQRRNYEKSKFKNHDMNKTMVISSIQDTMKKHKGRMQQQFDENKILKRHRYIECHNCDTEICTRSHPWQSPGENFWKKKRDKKTSLWQFASYLWSYAV